MSETRSVVVRISGRVQGVGFRDWTRQKAHSLGLSGWVRNLPDGDVEAHFSGSADAVESMLAACRRGPDHAHVDQVRLAETVAPATGPFCIW